MSIGRVCLLCDQLPTPLVCSFKTLQAILDGIPVTPLYRRPGPPHAKGTPDPRSREGVTASSQEGESVEERVKCAELSSSPSRMLAMVAGCPLSLAECAHWGRGKFKVTLRRDGGQMGQLSVQTCKCICIHNTLLSPNCVFSLGVAVNFLYLVVCLGLQFFRSPSINT